MVWTLAPLFIEARAISPMRTGTDVIHPVSFQKPCYGTWISPVEWPRVSVRLSMLGLYLWGGDKENLRPASSFEISIRRSKQARDSFYRQYHNGILEETRSCGSPETWKGERWGQKLEVICSFDTWWGSSLGLCLWLFAKVATKYEWFSPIITFPFSFIPRSSRFRGNTTNRVRVLNFGARFSSAFERKHRTKSMPEISKRDRKL